MKKDSSTNYSLDSFVKDDDEHGNFVYILDTYHLLVSVYFDIFFTILPNLLSNYVYSNKMYQIGSMKISLARTTNYSEFLLCRTNFFVSKGCHRAGRVVDLSSRERFTGREEDFACQSNYMMLS